MTSVQSIASRCTADGIWSESSYATSNEYNFVPNNQYQDNTIPHNNAQPNGSSQEEWIVNRAELCQFNADLGCYWYLLDYKDQPPSERTWTEHWNKCLGILVKYWERRIKQQVVLHHEWRRGKELVRQRQREGLLLLAKAARIKKEPKMEIKSESKSENDSDSENEPIIKSKKPRWKVNVTKRFSRRRKKFRRRKW